MEKTNVGAKTDSLKLRFNDIPYEGLQALAAIFQEGSIKYGVGNWKEGVGDKPYQEERLNHAIRHLMLYANGDRSENHLAKVAWFCFTQIWIEAQEILISLSALKTKPNTEKDT